jgi:lysine-ketoglutarate reductase/saccharopine dehydrogenase-like protein (TIGR00300 family)
MAFCLPSYVPPDLSILKDFPPIKTARVEIDGVAPDSYHAMSIFPEYFNVGGTWTLPEQSRMDCVAVLNGNSIDIVEFRNLHIGDEVVLGRSEDGRDGIFLHSEGFYRNNEEEDVFAFRAGRSRETAYSRDYDELYELLRYEREHGQIAWVLGPAASFDHDSRQAMSELIENGYVDVLFAGNALATHDLEGAIFKTALGQNIYTQKSQPNGHYNHLDLINLARRHGSLQKLIEEESGIEDGIIRAALQKNIPIVLAGSIRDDGPLPSVIGNVYESQDAMRSHIRGATTIITLATQLHTIATGNIAPSYAVRDGAVRPVFFYCIDVSEFALNKLRDRGSLSCTSIVANVQDFLVLLRNNLVGYK